MNLKNEYVKGISAKRFIEAMDTEQKTLHKAHDRRADIAEYKEKLKGFSTPVRILVITEPWCGDSAATLPVILKLIDGLDTIEIRFLYRDENPDLMDKYLTNGVRAIPKFIFMDGYFNELATWGPRPKAAQDIFESHREQIKTGEIEKSDVIRKIRNFYPRDRGQATAEEFVSILQDLSTRT